jgi:hypothetical protein
MTNQLRNTYTKAQLQQVIANMEMLESATNDSITRLSVEFTPQVKGSISIDRDRTVLFTPTYIQDSGIYGRD